MDERYVLYQARQAIYGLFQRLYQAAPDAGLLNWLITERPFVEFPVVLDETGMTALQQVEEASRTATLETLRDDFRQLYIGPGQMAVPPWESVHRNEERLLFDHHTLQVREFYARHGMEFVKKNQTPEDSMAIELEFLKLLVERVMKAVETGDAKAERILLEEQLAFLKQHLLAWAPSFVASSQKHAETGFYAGLAGVLGSFLAWERAVLEQLLESEPEDQE